MLWPLMVLRAIAAEILPADSTGQIARRLGALEGELEQLRLRMSNVAEEVQETLDRSYRHMQRAEKAEQRGQPKQQQPAAAGNGEVWMDPNLPKGERRAALSRHMGLG